MPLLSIVRLLSVHAVHWFSFRLYIDYVHMRGSRDAIWHLNVPFSNASTFWKSLVVHSFLAATYLLCEAEVFS